MGRLKKAIEYTNKTEEIPWSSKTKEEKEAFIWCHDLMHYVHGTGKYAELKRQLLRKHHPNTPYICECGLDEKRNPFVRYRLLRDFEINKTYDIEEGLAWWKKLIQDNPNWHQGIRIAKEEIKKLEKLERNLWLNLA